MNLQYLRYAVEVERTGSITRAAQTLFMGQPNLSRAIRELEKEVGITIFRRTAKGVEVTRRGGEFLSYAKSILSQLDELESLYRPQQEETAELSLSVPRASYVSIAFTEFVKTVDPARPVSFHFKETSSMGAVQDVANGESQLGVIRCQKIYEEYFLSYLRDMRIDHRPIWEFAMELLMSEEHPLAGYNEIPYHLLGSYTEVVHGDFQVPSLSFSEISRNARPSSTRRRIYVYERGSQFDLLRRVPGTYMWVSPVPDEVLRRHRMVLRPCPLSRQLTEDLFIFPRGARLGELEERFYRLLLAESKRQGGNAAKN